jgi:hypothetical protein
MVSITASAQKKKKNFINRNIRPFVLVGCLSPSNLFLVEIFCTALKEEKLISYITLKLETKNFNVNGFRKIDALALFWAFT